MNKIIFFDIDGTLFDVSIFLNELYGKFVALEPGLNRPVFNNIYEESKKEKGYFAPNAFLSKISGQFPSLRNGKLKEIFWDVDLFKKSLYKDISTLTELAKKTKLGIFSKGDLEFQKKKLNFLSFPIDTEHIYIFPDKIKKAKEIFGKYKDCEIYLIDDNLEVLSQIEKLTKVNLILIDRSNHYNYNSTNIRRVNNLKDLRKLL